jgi:nitrogenase molybdenum-iron protein beta chain
MAGTSSFTEGSSVFGGQANLLQAIEVMFSLYDPAVIAVHTTCLSETIGDDINQILQKARDDGKVPKGRHVLHCNTPSYVGSHITGYSNMVMGLVSYFAQKTGVENYQVNLISGWVEPADMREIKRLAKKLQANTIMFPDTSGILDSPLTGNYEMYPKGGTTIPELISAGDAKFTIGLGQFATEEAAKKLEYKCKVKYELADLPIGLLATDRFITTLSRHAGVKIPKSMSNERGRLVDMMADMHQYLHGKRVALFGDPDQLIPLTEFLVTCDMKPVYIVSGTPGKYFETRMSEILNETVPEAKFKNGERADIFLLHHALREARRVLRPGGKLFVTLVNRWALDGFYLHQRARQLLKRSGFNPTNPYCLFHTPGSAQRLLQRAGFIKVRTEGRLLGPVRMLYKISEGLGRRAARALEAFDDRLHTAKWTRPFAGHLVAIGETPKG